MRAPRSVEAAAETQSARRVPGVEDEAVGDVDELAGVLVGEQLGELRVRKRIQRGDLRKVGGDVIVLRGFVKHRQRVGVHLSIERRFLVGDEQHGLQPVGARGLEVEAAPRLAANGGEHGELVRAGVDAQFIAKVPGDGRVHLQFAIELRKVALVVDALLELAAKARRDGAHVHAQAPELIGDEEVLRRRGGRGRFVDGHLKVRAVALRRGDLFMIDAGGEPHGFGVDQRRLVEFVGVEGDAVALAGVERAIQVERLQLRHGRVERVAIFIGNIAADVLGAVQRDHRIAAAQRIVHFLARFQVIAVGAKARVEALAVDGEADAVQHMLERAVRQRQFADGLLGEHRREFGMRAERADVAGRADAQAVAHAHRLFPFQHAHGGGKGKRGAQRLPVFVVERTFQPALDVFAVKARSRAGDDERVLRAQIDHQHAGVRRLTHGSRVYLFAIVRFQRLQIVTHDIVILSTSRM